MNTTSQDKNKQDAMERHRAVCRRYYHANRDKFRRYYKSNRERLLAYNRKYREDNRGAYLERQRKYNLTRGKKDKS